MLIDEAHATLASRRTLVATGPARRDAASGCRTDRSRGWRGSEFLLPTGARGLGAAQCRIVAERCRR